MLAALMNQGGLVDLLIKVAVGGLIFWILYWGLGRINPPEPWKKVFEVILIVATVIFLISLLLSVSGVSL